MTHRVKRTLWLFLTGCALAGLGGGSLQGEEPSSEGVLPEAERAQVAQLAREPAPLADSALLSLDFREAEIQTVLQALGRKAGINIVTGSDIAGTVTIHLENVSWERALETVIQAAGLAYEKQENVIMVSTLDQLKLRREALKELVEIEPVITKVVQLKYLDAVDVKAFLEPQLTPQGKISVLAMTGQKGWKFGAAEAGGGGSAQDTRERREREGARSKAIVVTDTPTTIDRIEKILAKVDILPKQILIESRVMEVNRDLLRDLGFEIGTGTSSTSSSTSSGFVSSSTSRSFGQQSLNKADGGAADLASFGGSVLDQFLSPSVFVPKTTGLTAANTGLSMILRKLRGTQLEVLVRALEEDVRTNTLSAPRILTLSGQEARILIGEKFPILNTQVSGTTSTTTTTTLDYYQDIGIELFVVPQVGGDNHVDMIIHPVVSARTGSVGTNEYPILDVREAETQVILQHGETIVIGGLLKDVKAKARVGLPFLGKLPIVGPLFARTTTDMAKIDLLIFITAKIIEADGLSKEELDRLEKQYEEFFQEKVVSRKKRRDPHHAEDLLPPKPKKPNHGILYRRQKN